MDIECVLKQQFNILICSIILFSQTYHLLKGQQRGKLHWSTYLAAVDFIGLQQLSSQMVQSMVGVWLSIMTLLATAHLPLL